jgi:YqjK-like protein
VNSRLAALTARRRTLQAECELQRDDVRQLYVGIEHRTERVDHALETMRRLAPVIAIGGVVLMAALGPRRIVGLVRRSLTIALYANQARRALLG